MKIYPLSGDHEQKCHCLMVGYYMNITNNTLKGLTCHHNDLFFHFPQSVSFLDNLKV